MGTGGKCKYSEGIDAVKSEDIYRMYINGGRMTGGYGGAAGRKGLSVEIGMNVSKNDKIQETFMQISV